MDTTPFYLSYVALWVLVILHSLVLLGMLSIVYRLQQDRPVVNDQDLSLGKAAPVFQAWDLSGAPISSTDFAGRLTGLLFVSPDCPACTEVLDDIEYLNQKAQGNVIVICRARREECIQMASQYKLRNPIIEDRDAHIRQLYKVASVPTTVIIDANNTIRSYGQPLIEDIGRVFEKLSELEI